MCLSPKSPRWVSWGELLQTPVQIHSQKEGGSLIDGTFAAASTLMSPKGYSLKGMGVEEHPGITVHCCTSASLQGHDAIFVRSSGHHNNHDTSI